MPDKTTEPYIYEHQIGSNCINYRRYSDPKITEKYVEYKLYIHLHTHLQVIFQDTSKVILQLRPSKVRQNFLPIRRVLKKKTNISNC